MQRRVDISVVVSTYQRPNHLRNALESLAAQRGVDGRFEVVVCDDGSTDHTRDVVESFAAEAPFRVAFTTHRHDGFRLSQCRNEGATVAAAPYLLFTDGDCLLPPDHLAMHLRRRRPGRVAAGDCYRLDEASTARLTTDLVRGAAYRDWPSAAELKRVRQKATRARVYGALRVPMRPRLTGCNIGVWRDDFERVNGFDEGYVGWGYEDRDLQRRLARAGVRTRTILHWTVAYHQWHQRDPTFSRAGAGTANLSYYKQTDGRVRCASGLDNHREPSRVVFCRLRPEELGRFRVSPINPALQETP